MNKKLRASQLWYSPEQYNEVKSMMDDSDLLPGAYSLWKEGAEQREKQASRNGALVIRVPFDPEEFRSFCAHFHLSFNADARVKFSIIKAREKDCDSGTH